MKNKLITGRYLIARRLFFFFNLTLAGDTQTYAGVIVHPADLLKLHPGLNGDKSTVRWTAPVSGTYQLQGRFQGIDTTGTTSDVHILRNNVEVWNVNVNGYGA